MGDRELLGSHPLGRPPAGWWAFYEMLERVARKAGDEESATLASEICANEKQTADKIASKWDHFADVALHETAMG